MRDERDAGASGISHPLLFECDGAVREDRLPGEMMELLRDGKSLRVWPALVMRESVLVAAQVEAAEPAAGEALSEKLLTGYFRLEDAERKLAAKLAAAPRNGAPRRSAPALRQVERERQRLGSELHTGVGQLLAAIGTQLDAIEEELSNPAAAVRESLDRIGWLSQEALRQVRGISSRLYPPEWQRLTLEAALRQLWESSGMERQFDGALRLETLEREPSLEIKTLIYRAAQEGLSNVARHSRATRVQMTLETWTARIVLTVRDNGRGFPALSAAADAGLGLRSLRDAAAEAGARVSIESAPGSTALRVWSPF